MENRRHRAFNGKAKERAKAKSEAKAKATVKAEAQATANNKSNGNNKRKSGNTAESQAKPRTDPNCFEQFRLFLNVFELVVLFRLF